MGNVRAWLIRLRPITDSVDPARAALKAGGIASRLGHALGSQRWQRE